MGTNCAPLVADLFSFCYERDFMLSLSDNNQTDIIEAFNSTGSGSTRPEVKSAPESTRPWVNSA